MWGITRRLKEELREWPILSCLILSSPVWLFVALVAWAVIWNPSKEPVSVPSPAAADAASGDGLIQPLYFDDPSIPIGVRCPADTGVNWNIAIVALSDYMEYGPYATTSPNAYGPAEIERNFEENCTRDMKIYNEAVRANPALLQEGPAPAQ